MRKGLVIIGVILLVVGLLMMLFLWPMVGTIDSEELAEKIAAGESGTFTVMEEMSQDDWDSMDEISKAAAEEQGIDGPGTYIYTVKLEDGMPTEMSEDFTKVPTIGGILGLVLMIVGIILLIVGFITGKAAAPAPEQPPMEQPYQEPPPEQPPMPPQ
jgi:hypothetical protein